MKNNELVLADNVHSAILRISAEAEKNLDEGRHDLARRQFQSAIEILPQPSEQWEAYTWLAAAIGDSFFLQRNFLVAEEWFRRIMVHEAPGSRDNAFLRLRRGQCNLELGNIDKANEELISAYMLGGEDVFLEEDPRYFEQIRSLVRSG